MAEGNETHGAGTGAGQSGGWAPEGRQRGGEADLLAERRARRAAESPEHLLVRRAETAEATVRTLEAHVTSLQQRLREAEEERRRVSELIDSGRLAPAPAPGAPGVGLAGTSGAQAGAEGLLEGELRRARQREYAEQRLRVETEERLIETERDNRAQLERLSRELADSEAQERVLAVRIETLQRELAEAEQSAAAERAAARRAEGALAEKVAELDAQAAELRRELEAERAARLRAEQTIEALRLGHRRLELIAHELRAGMADLRAAAAAGTAAAVQAPVWQRREQPAAAPAAEPVAGRRQPAAPATPVGSGPGNGEMVEALAAAVERLRARVAEGPAASPTAASAPPRHKHSMSLIGRWRMARKQRRQR
jgi:hypothetical protein